MIEKKRKILDVSENNSFFNIDIRVSIPKKNISQELIDDLISNKDGLVNGSGNQIYFVKIKQNEEGHDILQIESEYYFGVE